MSQSLKRLIRLVGPQKRRLIASCALSVIGTAMGLVPFILIYLAIIELMEPVVNEVYIWKLIIGGIAAILLKFVTMALSGSLSHIAAYNILYDLRIKLAWKLGTLSQGYFNTRNTGEVKSTMNDHVEKIEIFIAHQLPDVTAAAMVPIFTAIFLFIVNWRMALATMALIPVAFLVLGMSYRGLGTMLEKYYKSIEKLNSTVIEYTQGMAVIKAFNQTVDSFARYRNSMEEYRDFLWKWSIQSVPYWTLFMVLITANVLVILPAGVWLYNAGSLSMADFILFFMLGLGLCEPLVKLTTHGEQFAEVVEAEKRINGILTEKPLSEPEGAKAPSGFNMGLLNVHFGYNETEVLHDITFSVPQNTVTALVGTSGAGKTTIARLIPRFWDVRKGEITIGDCNIKELPTTELSSLTAFVFQDVFLFNETIYENIRMGKKGVGEGEVIAAARMAHCHEFIESLPNGYQTIAGERGAKLSGGERQRISIARAILKDAPIIILDEATAFVDPENEDLIQDAIGRLSAGKTLIIIAHRLSTITEADQIVVLDEGKIVEKGTHQELLKAGNMYRRMWEAHMRAQDWKFET
ncbi:MAG: putative ABC transporter ATP-binding protein [Candidatus Methanolliviera sp. GoM_oil]|nr:MAG: putative ABC transporter ATP-binding protein [Candidatus Methanolliviera sp. GoM_oil]